MSTSPHEAAPRRYDPTARAVTAVAAGSSGESPVDAAAVLCITRCAASKTALSTSRTSSRGILNCKSSKRSRPVLTQAETSMFFSPLSNLSFKSCTDETPLATNFAAVVGPMPWTRTRSRMALREGSRRHCSTRLSLPVRMSSVNFETVASPPCFFPKMPWSRGMWSAVSE